MTVQIRGLTARDTHYTVSPAPDCRVRLHVEFHTGDAHHAIARACVLVGQGSAAQYAAMHAAHHLRRGRRVTVWADGLDFLNGRLIVTGNVRVTPDDAVARHHLESHSEGASA